jgi:hypothetical protein
MYSSFNRLGYTGDSCGYSGAFSWWRDGRYRWRVCCHEASFCIDSVLSNAVVDDFGSLVRVP